MNIRKKIIIVVTLVMIGLVGTLLVFARMVILKNSIILEQKDIMVNLDQAVDSVIAEVQNLDVMTADWSYWDDTYQFLTDKNQFYLINNLNDATFNNLRLNYALFIKNSDEIIYSKSFDYREMRPLPDNQEFIKEVVTLISSTQWPELNISISGILSLSDGPLLVSIRPVLTSLNKGPSPGFLVFGRWLDLKEVERLTEINHLKLSLYLIDTQDLPRDVEQVKAQMLVNPTYLFQPQEKNIIGFGLMNDIYEKPALIVRVEKPRVIYTQGVFTLSYLMVALIIVGVISLIVIFFLLRKIVISPLGQLNQVVQKIRTSQDLTLRVPHQGEDELSKLSQEINQMLDEIHQYQKKLQNNELRLRTLFENTMNPIFIINLHGEFVELNQAALHFFECNQDQILNHKIQEFLSEESDSFFENLQSCNKRESVEREFTIHSLSKTLLLNLLPLNIDDTIFLYCIGQDITARILHEKLLFSEKEYLSVTLKSIGDGVIVTDQEGKITLMNSVAEKLTGWNNNEARGQLIDQVFHIIDELTGKEYKNPFQRVLENGEKIELENNTILISRSGNQYFIADSASPIRDIGNKIIGFVLVFRDVSEKRKAIEHIKFLSFHDKLTGLYNRAFFDEESKRLDTDRQFPLSIILGDVDNLKFLNDTFGHETGDILLKRIAKILKSVCRKEDIISRWGGDEFILLLPQTPQEKALEVCERINKLCQESQEELLPLSIALGAATKKTKDEKFQDILREAEDQMYRNKILKCKSHGNEIVPFLRKLLMTIEGENEDHFQRVCRLVIAIGNSLNLPDRLFYELKLLSTFHDIGKVALPKQILEKTGELLPDEKFILKRHPEIGYRIAKSSQDLLPIASAILSFHEWWDGSGYPLGIRGNDIPIASRIVSVVDQFDHLTQDLSHRKAITKQEALEKIKHNAGKRFDPNIVEVFTQIIIENGTVIQ
jgi:diguanylate cyclase (GGDEF)-like protein/PAS domain S-box-containing protein